MDNAELTSVENILKTLHVAEASGTDQISSKFLKDGAPVTTTHLTNIINLPIKLNTLLRNGKYKK